MKRMELMNKRVLQGISSLLLLLILMLPLLGCSYNYDKFHSREWKTYDLVALQCSGRTTVSGGFFLGSSSINTNARLYFYTKDEDGSIILRDVNPSFAVIYEDDSVTPYCRIKESYSTRWYVCDAEFYIPKDSVLSNYTLTTP